MLFYLRGWRGVLRIVQSFSVKWGGTWQHMSGWLFILLNGSILAIHLRSYSGQDLKSHPRIWNIDSRSDGWDITMLSLNVIIWHDLDTPMKIRQSWIDHNDSPLWIPSQSLISSRRRPDGHTQFFLLDGKYIIGCFELLICIDMSIFESLDFIFF